jgi:predicted MFS family arabinose efflux permease
MPLLVLLVGFEIGVSLFGTLVPQVQQEFAVSAGTVALAISAYHGIRLVTNVPAGRLIARSSLPRALAFGGMLLAAGALIVGLAPVFAAVLAGRIVMGVGSAFFFITTQFWISKAATRENKTRLFSYHQIAGLSGGALGPALGGAVAGWLSWRHAFLLAVAAGLIAATTGLRLRSPSNRREGSAPTAPKSPGRLQIGTVLGPGTIMAALFFYHGGVLSTLVPLFAARRIGLGPAAIGSVLMLGTIWRFGAALIGGRLATWLGTRRVVLTSLVLMAVTVLALHLVDSPLGLIVAFSLMAWSHVGGSLVVALLTDLVPEAHWGTALGVNRTFADVGAMIAPILVGSVIDRAGFHAAITVVALVLATAAGAGAVLTTARHIRVPTARLAQPPA